MIFFETHETRYQNEDIHFHNPWIIFFFFLNTAKTEENNKFLKGHRYDERQKMCLAKGSVLLMVQCVLFCLCPENEVIEETKHSYHKDFSHILPTLKKTHSHTRQKRSTGEPHTAV